MSCYVNLTIDREIIEDFSEWLREHVVEMLEFPGFKRAEIFKEESLDGQFSKGNLPGGNLPGGNLPVRYLPRTHPSLGELPKKPRPGNVRQGCAEI